MSARRPGHEPDQDDADGTAHHHGPGGAAGDGCEHGDGDGPRDGPRLAGGAGDRPSDAPSRAGGEGSAEGGDLVWYVAYGSNMDRSRLRTYLDGDRHLGAGSTHEGARDPSPPLADAPHELPLEVFFAGRSTRWEGAVAYCDHGRRAEGPALARRWLLRRSQFEDLVRQENRHAAGLALAWDRCRVTGHVDALDGRYGRVVWLGEEEGVPLVTATCARAVTPPGPAGVAYLRVIARGLAESWGLDHREAARYLAARPGNAGRLDAGALAEALLEPVR